MDRRRSKRKTDKPESNSIHLYGGRFPSEERKDFHAFNPDIKHRRGYSPESSYHHPNRPSRGGDLTTIKIMNNNNKRNDIGEGLVVQDPDGEKYYVIKENGLIADQGQQEYQTITNEIRTIPFTVKDPTSSLVTLLKSPFKDRLETFYFPYPDFCIEEKDEEDRVIRIDQDEFETCRSYFRYDTNIHIYNSVVRACNEAGLFLKDKKLLIKYRYMQQQEKRQKNYDEKIMNGDEKLAEKYINTPDRSLVDENYNDFNIRFSISCKKEDLRNITKYQKINHFPMSYYLGRKDQLYRNYQIREDLFLDDYNFMPKTYIFPTDAAKFEEERESTNYTNHKKKLWIFKPTASSCGRGIKIVDSTTKIPHDNKGFLISDYITNPHLIKGYKYDLRVYVLVTNFDPLTVYINNDGLVRFCTVKYRTDTSTLHNKFMHISNYSIQKESKMYRPNTDASDDSSKWNFTMWEEAIKEQGHDVKVALLKIEDIVIKTLISAQDLISNAYDSMTGVRNVCYELYGFDVMFDSHMNPWLLEVNTNPSLSSNSPLDKMLKTKVCCDTLTLVGVKPISFPELRMREQYEGKEPLRPNEYEG